MARTGERRKGLLHRNRVRRHQNMVDSTQFKRSFKMQSTRTALGLELIKGEELGSMWRGVWGEQRKVRPFHQFYAPFS